MSFLRRLIRRQTLLTVSLVLPQQYTEVDESGLDVKPFPRLVIDSSNRLRIRYPVQKGNYYHSHHPKHFVN